MKKERGNKLSHSFQKLAVQYPGRGAWLAIAHEVTQSQTLLSMHTHTYLDITGKHRWSSTF